MKKLIYLLLFPLSSWAQIYDPALNLEADTIRLETQAGHNTAKRIGRMFKNIIAAKPNYSATGGFDYSDVSGTNSYSGTLYALTSIYQGLHVRIKIGNTNTAAPATLNLNGLGAYDIRMIENKLAVEIGFLQAGTIYDLNFDGTYFIVQPSYDIQNGVYVTTGHGTDTYTCGAIGIEGSLSFGKHIRIHFDNGNTGPATLNVNTLGAAPLTKNGTVALSAGDIVANQFYEVQYDGTNWQILNAPIGTAVTEGAWINVSLTNGWASVTGGNTVQYRIVGSTVQLRGVLDGSSASSDTFSTGHSLPDPQVAGGASNIAIPIVDTSTGLVQLQVHGAAGLGIIPSHTTHFYDVNGVTYTK